MIRNIIFDWSGTLVDDLPAVWRATNFVFSQAGVAEISLEQFRAEFCLPFQGFYDRYTPHVPMSQLELWFHGHYREAQASVAPLPHARDFLLFCRKHGVRTFLLSTLHHEHFLAQSKSSGFHEFLDRPYTGILDKKGKIHELLEENHLRPDETLFVGDMQHDMETARHGGVHSCAVLTGYNSLEQLRASKPDLIVEHLGELQGILQSNGFELRPADASRKDAVRHPVVTVGALIFNESGEVLMVRTHKWSDRWGIPGGKTKFGEASEEALRREIKEETGLNIDGIRFVLVQDCIHSREFYRDEHFVLLNYTCRCAGEARVRLNEEASACAWMPPAQALTMELNQPTRILIEAVLAEAGRDVSAANA